MGGGGGRQEQEKMDNELLDLLHLMVLVAGLVACGCTVS